MKLQLIEKEVDSLKDRLGMEIDPNIKKAVIAFRLWDMPTIMSCEGHSNRALPYPWIDIEDSTGAYAALMDSLLEEFYSTRERDIDSIKMIPWGEDLYHFSSVNKRNGRDFVDFCVRDEVVIKHLQKHMNDFADFLINKWSTTNEF